MKLLKKPKATKLEFGGPSTWIQDAISWACTFKHFAITGGHFIFSKESAYFTSRYFAGIPGHS